MKIAISTGLISICFVLVVVADDLFQQYNDNMTNTDKEQVLLESLANSILPVSDRFFLIPENINSEDIKFILYCYEKPNDGVIFKSKVVNDFKHCKNSTGRPMKILIHGWLGSNRIPWFHGFRKIYISKKMYNVVLVDWSVGSLKSYFTSATLTKQVGECVAQFISFLTKSKIVTLEDIHILGHSLGAHIAGITGSSLSGKIGRITGMDPASPIFEAPVLKDAKYRLDRTDAKFVDVIHTCAGTLGFIKPLGHVDFYPNSGRVRQPGCPNVLTQICSHERSHQFMAESINNPKAFPALECSNWRDFQLKKCKSNKKAYMGEQVDVNARGIYFLETNAKPPFGKS